MEGTSGCDPQCLVSNIIRPSIFLPGQVPAETHFHFAPSAWSRKAVGCKPAVFNVLAQIVIMEQKWVLGEEF